ncbi:MAG: hypothetical protein ACRDGQ_08430, partial [Candidatus Limnocylindrales bacterium]
GSTSTRLNFRAAFEDAAGRPGTEPRYEVGCRLLAGSAEHSVAGMMRYLRDHFGAGSINGPQPDGSAAHRTVCLHPGPSLDSTAASMVVELSGSGQSPVAWMSMATPCTSIFLPVTVGQRLPIELETGDQRPGPNSAWWAMRELQSVADGDPMLLAARVQATWGPIEQELLSAGPPRDPGALAGLVREVMERRDQLIVDLSQARSEGSDATSLS